MPSSATGTGSVGVPPTQGVGREFTPFLVVGLACVVGGGLLAAVTAPVATEHSSWAAAYLVLVGGVAQAGLGLGQAVFATGTPSSVLVAQLTGWNLGNAAVLVGTLVGATVLVDLGGALLVVALALLARGVGARGVASTRGSGRYWLLGYRLIVLVLLAGIPTGLVLARLRG